MAMIMCTNIGAQPAHQLDEAGEARGDEGSIVDLAPAFRWPSPMTRTRHGDAVIHVRRDQAAAGRATAALHDQVVALDFDLDAVGPQPCRRRRRADRIPSRAIP